MPTVVTVDPAQRAKLLAADDVIEFRDETGELVLRWDRPAKAKEWPPAAPPGYEYDREAWPSVEELDRRVREEKGYTAAEVIAYMRGRAGERE